MLVETLKMGPESWPTVACGDTPMPPAIGQPSEFLLPPQQPDEMGRLGHYRILRKLGAGGMGIVYLAEDIHLKRQVALKVLQPEAAADRGARQRFLREAQAAANLEHENIVTIFQVGEERGVPYLAMQLLKGMSLEDRLRQAERANPPALLSVAEIAHLGRQVARGLAAAHERGLIHRDIKPANIWLEGRSEPRPLGSGGTANPSLTVGALTNVKILDFGLVRPVKDDAHITQSGSIMGTPAYMAPEQARGALVDPRCDLFSLGVVLYRMCTGRMPFTGQGTMAVLTSLAVDDPKPVSELNPAVPKELADLVMQLLHKDPTQRPPSAQAVAARLADLQAGQTIPLHAKPVPLAVPVKRAPAPNPWADIDVTEPTLPRAEPRPKGSGARNSLPIGRGPGRRLLIAAIAAIVLLGGGLLLQQIIIRDKDGKEVPLVLKDKRASKSEPRPKESGDTSADRKAAEWVLSIGGKVSIRTAGDGKKLIERFEDLPAGGVQVEEISLNYNQKATDAGFALLGSLTNLTHLYLLDVPLITDTGLAHLESQTQLTYLDLSCPRVTDAGLVHLVPLINLTYLRLYGTSVGDRGLAHLRDCLERGHPAFFLRCGR